MPLQGAGRNPPQPIIHRPVGIVDSIDGTNAFPGAMAQLANLIPDPSTAGVWMARPPALEIEDFSSFTTPGFISVYRVIGDRLYGMIASGLNAGKDQPFVYDLPSQSFIAVTGITNPKSPTSQGTVGSWTPPTMAQVGGRVIVTHPGFADDVASGDPIKFGWFDISGAELAVVGNTVSSSYIVTGYPSITGIQPGMLVSGSGIPANTTVTMAASAFTGVSFAATTNATTTVTGIGSTAAMRVGYDVTGPGIPAGTTIAQIASGTSIILSKAATSSLTYPNFVASSPSPSYDGYISGTLTSGSATITVSDTTGLWVGQEVFGTGIRPGSFIVSLVANTSITLNQTVTTTGTGPFSVAGNIIALSQGASATANNVALTIEGGTYDAPLWGAGDTQLNPLPSAPVGVAQMNGRAYFACGRDGIPFSDSGLPCQISNASRVQALTTNDGLAVTAIAPIELNNALLGGIVQALIAFEGDSKMQQITGDMAFNNLSMNALSPMTGTLAPNSICDTELGLAFVSPEGLRVIDGSGRVSQPIGDAGTGITVPFIYAVEPSRICAAANAHFIRITTQNGDKDNSPFEEYWYDIGRKSWCGPHTSWASMIQPWGDQFVMTFAGSVAKLWTSAVVPQTSDDWLENGAAMTWIYQTVLLP